jgi:hypothetical protein
MKHWIFGSIMGKLTIFSIFFILTAAAIFFFVNKQAASESISGPSQFYLTENENKNGYNTVQAQQNSGQQNNRAEQVVKALFAAYPRQIERVEFRNDDWALLMRGAWFYYAEGKLLPENMLQNAAIYNPQPFYNYQKELPPWTKPGAEDAARFSNMASNRSANPPQRSPHFFETLWRIRNRDEAYQRVKSILFLGKTVTVHYMIMENLALVEEQILAAAKTNPQVQSWVNNINTLDGWSWRDIADTQSRSFHAYGLAIDLLPKSLGGKQTYWLWAARNRSDWWNISYNERYHPPEAVIRAFENYGFIWGGKWLFFDTMHFEYRPEILILSGMPPEIYR